VPVTNFSAQESALGYLYQARYALWLLLDGPEERETDNSPERKFSEENQQVAMDRWSQLL